VVEAAARQDEPLTVSQLTRYMTYLVESDELLGSLAVKGEISEFTRSSAGHSYFKLKDANSQVSCVFFRQDALRQPSEQEALRQGVAVTVHGHLTIYEPRGEYQIRVMQVRVLGDGAFAQRFEQLKARLEREGLFAQGRKRKLPKYPRTLALITAPDSQAYHDVLHRLRFQYPFVRVIVAGVTVQGESASEEMVMAIDIVNRLTQAEGILLVRGGGAPEDLRAFNDERLARAIFASSVPIVTGIGHENDHTIADFVADIRAATPSLAAAAAVPDVSALVIQSVQLHANATHLMRERLRAGRRRWQEASRGLARTQPAARLRTQRQRADELQRTSDRVVTMQLRTRRDRWAALNRQLQALDPLAILARGYALLTDSENGRVVSRVADAIPGRKLAARVADGTFMARVEET
jgi:exodeoxyribonuclease VII large subunit